MKKIYIPALIIVLAAVFSLFYFRGNSLNSKLDDLEKIVDKYEPQFDSLVYESKEYSDMIVDYNKEIFAWAEVFDKERYIRDEKGRIIHDYNNQPQVNKEFNKEVEKRFYDLNNRMTRMVLRNIPKSKMKVESSESQDSLKNQ